MANEDIDDLSSDSILTKDDGLYWLKKGEIYWVQSKKDWKAAKNTIKYFDKAIQLEPLNFFAWANKGLILKIMGRVKDALACYDRALWIQPMYVNAWYNKAVLLGSIGKFKTAKKCYKKVLVLDPSNRLAKRDLKLLKEMIRKKRIEKKDRS
jgi:tetratricopeptide (TPR) repeat protein